VFARKIRLERMARYLGPRTKHVPQHKNIPGDRSSYRNLKSTTWILFEGSLDQAEQSVIIISIFHGNVSERRTVK